MYVGYHVSRREVKDAANALEIACKNIINYGFAPSVQIFVTGPRTDRVLFDDPMLAKIKDTIVMYNAKLYIHGAYIDVPWSKSSNSCDNIIEEMSMAEKCGALGVVVHLSKNAHGENLKWVLEYLNDKITETEVVLFLEINTAKSSEFTFETPEKIHKLFNDVNKLKLKFQVGLCIDTAHLFSCGTSLSTIDEAQTWFKNLSVHVPMLIHLNDSRSTLGSGKDQHQKLCQGAIWNKFDSNCGLLSVIEWTQVHDVPIILERDENNDSTDDLSLLNFWYHEGKLV